MHMDLKYVGEIQNLEYHGTLLNGNNCFGIHAQHAVNTSILQMQGHNMLSIILSLLPNCKQENQ